MFQKMKDPLKKWMNSKVIQVIGNIVLILIVLMLFIVVGTFVYLVIADLLYNESAINEIVSDYI
ncbi:MAG: hypothetical protein ACQEWU_01780 [Bacillota bacterium]|uniref:Uncharacterized protein n=1 Tax=Virgibacillus salarius TaxID=447199 RepID=A0A941DV32_9BACI|nr:MULTISPECIES: hypothetical protein [Bacillaceae]NAZ08974.1 hypothetical protein [Agaribacter marinus]MBR7796266.1 hypothetical protein [Virgibacillus salarius]MCC2248497.1 hypothetical protein [Virgibacillus sp. AGTR]MDY7043068.1 hypothetical protein [Virgibacillus sp. M23]QRZ16639.1 hypothetical protein JUJ52_12580 [Virgibacillus sp. AGTR]